MIAQDAYDALTEKGYRVFFSRISLEDKLGTEYEPYIFAALNSAKVMLVFGTDFEYFNAVWVKNEWSRFLALMTTGQKKSLIPCYKGIDAYDMPKEFAKLQAQDMGKVGAIQDLLRGIDKIMGKGATPAKEVVVGQQVTVSAAPGVESLLKRGYMALEDGEWQKADGFFEQVLNMDAECARAYWGKALATQCCRSSQDLIQQHIYAKEVETVRLTACVEDTEQTESAIEQFYLPGYIDKVEIENQFRGFDRTYASETSFWKKRLDEEVKYFTKDKLIHRVSLYAQEDLALQLQNTQCEVIDALKSLVSVSEENDRKCIQEIIPAYSDYLDEVHRMLVYRYGKT